MTRDTVRVLPGALCNWEGLYLEFGERQSDTVEGKVVYVYFSTSFFS